MPSQNGPIAGRTLQDLPVLAHPRVPSTARISGLPESLAPAIHSILLVMHATEVRELPATPGAGRTVRLSIGAQMVGSRLAPVQDSAFVRPPIHESSAQACLFSACSRAHSCGYRCSPIRRRRNTSARSCTRACLDPVGSIGRLRSIWLGLKLQLSGSAELVGLARAHTSVPCWACIGWPWLRTVVWYCRRTDDSHSTRCYCPDSRVRCTDTPGI